MPFSKRQLLDSANVRAAELGMPLISESVFETWVYKGLLDGARAEGHQRGINPSWAYPDEAREKVICIVELQANGAKRHTQKLICLWMLGNEFRPGEIMPALAAEFGRTVKRMSRGPAWWQNHFEENLSAAERSKRIGQLPELDPDLTATGLALSKEAIFEIALRSHWGEAGDSRIPSIVAKDLGQKFGLPKPLPQELFWFLDVNGAFGPPDESAHGGPKIFERISFDDLETARSIFWLAALGLVAGAVIARVFDKQAENQSITVWEKVLASIRTPEWMTMLVALFAISAFHRRSRGVEKAIFA